MSLPTIQTDRLTLRLITSADIAGLLSITHEPSVNCWWGASSDEDRVSELAEVVASETGFVAVCHSQIVGWVQFYEESDPDYRRAGLDVAFTTLSQDLGYGSEALRAVAGWLIDERKHHRLIIDPDATNHRAIRCYERIGFKHVGIMRRYNRAPNGVWRDGLLMDLLDHELIRQPLDKVTS